MRGRAKKGGSMRTPRPGAAAHCKQLSHASKSIWSSAM